MVGPLHVNITLPPPASAADDEEYSLQAESLKVFLRKYTVAAGDGLTYTIKEGRLAFQPTDNINTFFKDGVRKIDFVLAFEAEKLKSPVELAYISEFIHQLERQGLQFEFDVGVVEPMIFIKCHLPKLALKHFAIVYRVELNNPGRLYLESEPLFKFAIPHISQYKEKMIPPYMDSVSSERILIIYKIMESVKFGRFEHYSLKRMLEEGYFKHAYPLHDSRAEWPDEPPYSSRQILSKYWASLDCWYKYQPLNLIKQYYGTEQAFYFAWFGFYNQMLIVPSILGTIVELVGIVSLLMDIKPQIREICYSNKTVCPICYSKKCSSHQLKWYCHTAKITLLSEHHLFFYPLFMMIWAMFVCQLWRRKEAILRLKWQADISDVSNMIRADYKRKTKFRKISPITGMYEPYIPTKIVVRSMMVTMVVCTFLVIIMFFVAWVSNIAALYFTENKPWPEVIIRKTRIFNYVVASVLVICFIAVFKRVCNSAAVFLTDLENPRTEHEYDGAVIIKMLLLNFFNNFASLFYLFLAVGLFDQLTSEEGISNIFIRKQCYFSGCVVPGALQLFSFLGFKYLLVTVYEVIKIGVGNLMKQFKSSDPLQESSNSKIVPFWEEEYGLEATGRFGFTSEFMDIMNQYGFVVLFSAVFPLGPLFVIVNNILRTRLMAWTINSKQRRRVPVRVEGMGAFDDFLTFFTYLSIITNGFLLAFSVDFAPRIRYYIAKGNLWGYIDSILSEYDVKDYPKPIRKKLLSQNVTTCYYRGFRYAPNHPQKYKRTSRYWQELIGRFVLLIVFEHLFFVVLKIIAYAIPDIPLYVKQQLQEEKEISKELKVLFRRHSDSKSKNKRNRRSKQKRKSLLV